MTTAEKINNFSDAGKFQCLMDSIIRFSNPEYNPIMSTGVNIEGKAIKSPLDSFTQVPGSHHPKFVMVQHTTAKLADLENKWLFDHTTATGNRKVKGNDGDVVKAGKQAQEIRKNNSDAEFFLILTTNRHLSLNKQKKQDPLVLKTYQKCQEYNIHCEIWEQSRITHFLDNTPEGHWLRKEYLGIEAELLSGHLLETICKINLERYKQSFFLGNDEIPPREMEILVEQEIIKQNQGLHLLIGESGFGKSTIAYHILKKHLESGGYGLWISVDNIEEGVPLENIICNVLKQIYPKIQINSENEFWKFTQKDQFFIIIDDLNRSSDPIKILQRVISFLPQESTKIGDSKIKIPFMLICPVWPKYWIPISREFQKISQIKQIHVNKFSLIEAESLIFNAFQKCDNPITRLQANQVAKKLGCDPLLIGLFSQFLRHEDTDVSHLLSDVIEHFIQRNLDEIAQKSASHFQGFEYKDVLVKICKAILIQKQFFPTFTQINAWLNEFPNDILIFRDLITNRVICSIDNEKLVFRHDRIQFYLLTQSMVKILESDAIIRSNVISEPFYAELLGQAILFKEQSDIQLDEIQEKNSLSLLEALKIFSESNTDYHNKIVDRIIAGVKEQQRKEYPLPSIIEAICWIIIDTDSSAIIPITDYLPDYHFVKFSRIRNGCVMSGVQYCDNFEHFEPGSNFPLRDRIFEHAKEKHYQKILIDLKKVLQSSEISDKKRYGALIFSGFLKIPSIQKDILTCWNNAQDKNQILPAALWAGLNCCEDDPDEYLTPIFEQWAKMPNLRKDGNLSELEQISDEIRLALMIKRKVSNSVVKFCISQSKKHESFNWAINDILYVIDDPDAIEFIVVNSSDLFALSFMKQAWDYKRQTYGQKLSDSSLNRLESIWMNLKESEKNRKNAFILWTTAAKLNDLEKLQKILPESSFFTHSILLRVELHDFSVLPEYLQLISKNSWDLRMGYHIWCEDLQKCVEKYLESFKDSIPKDFKGGREDVHYNLANLLMAIPPKDAEKILSNYWDILRYSPIFIHTALYVGTPELLKLAEMAIKEWPPEIDIFEHISHIFWFTDYNGGQNNLTNARLNNLKPYFNRFSKKSLSSLARLCKSCGFVKWGKENLYKYLSSEDKKRFYPSDDDIVDFFKKVTQREHGIEDIQYIWLEKLEEDLILKERLFKIVEKMLVNDPSFKTFQIASVCVKMKGTRKDLGLLNKYSIRGSKKKISDIVRDVQFHVYRRTLE